LLALMKRTAFIVDGFNLYHSACDASDAMGLRGRGTKWLDLSSLCCSYLAQIGGGAQLDSVHYFSALATHLEPVKPDVTVRHRIYLEALRDTGVGIELSKFKLKDVKCPACSHAFRRAEEKETDVAIAAKLLEVFATDRCDAAVLMTGDTDIAPAVRTAASLFPLKQICFAFPFARKNKELSKLVSVSFTMAKESYRKHQFPNVFTLSTGRLLEKPDSW
jgi:uncharacterized LabA/DUF88 family protein